MISFKELLHGHNVSDLTIAQQHNLEELQRRVNIIREAYGKPMTVTSGFRTRLDQERINPKVTKSRHMEGKAVDIYDPDQELQKFLLANVDLLVSAELWCEDFSATKNWVHFQSEPPLSGRRFFKP